MTSSEIIAEYTALGQCIATESLLGEQLTSLTKEQRAAHQATLQQKDRCNNLDNDKSIIN